jgi:hypothetical protein
MSPLSKTTITSRNIRDINVPRVTIEVEPCDHPAVSLESLGCCLWI